MPQGRILVQIVLDLPTEQWLQWHLAALHGIHCNWAPGALVEWVSGLHATGQPEEALGATFLSPQLGHSGPLFGKCC